MDELPELHHCIDSAMIKLMSIWDKIGITGEQRSARVGVVLMHMGNLLDEMVKEEDSLRSRLMENVDKYKTEIIQLCKELNLLQYEAPSGLTVLQLEKDLRSRVELMNKEKQDRLRQMKQRTKVDQQLCDALSSVPYFIPPNSVPSEQQLAELEDHISGLEVEKSKRQKILLSTRQSITRLLEELELSPNTSFEREVVCDSEMVSLTTDNMRALKRYNDELERLRIENASTVAKLWESLKSLWNRVDVSEEDREMFQTQNSGLSQRTIQSLKEEIGRCEVLKLENIQHVIESTRKELITWWDKCYMAAEYRQMFGPLSQDELTEELLVLHEDELKRMREYYEENKVLLDKITRRQSLWTEFLDLERKANNPDRFLNRGCSLLKEEKARKKMAIELPKLDQEISHQIQSWENVTGKQFLVCGVTFDDFVQRQNNDYIAEKENEKAMRQQQKARQMEEEILYGSKPAVSGTKRFAGNTPTKTPNKLRKVNESPKSCHKNRPAVPAFFSPVCLPPRTTSREKLNTLGVKAAIDASAGVKRTPFAEQSRNTTPSTMNSMAPPPSITSLPSTTIVSSSNVNAQDVSHLSVGAYDEFASGLSNSSKPNCNSTFLHKGAYF